eukprot:gene13960-16977_t
MEQSSPEKRIQWLYFFIAIAILVNLSGLFVTIMEPDGALYASIAKNMLLRNNFSELFVEGRDWLDKPHFPFWAAAIAFKMFGVHTWSYKLPALLVMFMGTAYTYRFAKDLYAKETGLWAALILLTAQHTVISNMDVRAEPYLTGFIMAAVYHFYKGLGKGWFVQVLVGSLFAACAVMTKGIFALIPVGGAIAGHLMLTRQWKLLFNLRWLVAALLILVFILPELWCLYQQFDLHPEKLVFGKHGVSGVKFFFWDSQFGRFFNSGPIKKSPGDPTFFLHTILWAYLPWSFLFYIAVVQYIRKGYKKVRNVEWFNLPDLSAFALLLLASSFILIVAVWRMPSAGKFKLLTYQPDSEAAFWMNINNKENLPVVRVLNGLSYAVEFYSNDEIYHYRLGEQNKLPARPYLIYTEADVVPLLENEGIKGQRRGFDYKSGDTHKIENKP